MDIQKLEQIVLEDARADAQNLINKTKKEVEHWFLEQSTLLQEEHREDINRINNDHDSKLATMKTFLAADYYKNLVKAKKDKNTILATKLMKTLQAAIEKNPNWILEKAFSQVPIKSGKILVSQDLTNFLTQEKVEVFLKKYPGFTFAGTDKELNSGMCFELNSVRYIFPLQEVVDKFLESESEIIMSYLIP